MTHPNTTPPQIIPVLAFRPTAEGLRRWFHPLEAEIMQHIWEAGRPVTVKAIHRQDTEGRTYTTIMTTMTRLWQKGILERKRETMAFVYTPRLSLADFERYQLDKVMAAVAEYGDTIGV